MRIWHVNNENSWLMLKGSTRRILDWWPAYGNAHYEQVGLADMRVASFASYSRALFGQNEIVAGPKRSPTDRRSWRISSAQYPIPACSARVFWLRRLEICKKFSWQVHTTRADAGLASCL
jgi:hypothetical protein